MPLILLILLTLSPTIFLELAPIVNIAPVAEPALAPTEPA